ncbi:putative letm1-like protein [Podospora aff. communis PSN243]|uniref:Letm1-like protein n=1 Tax=Podospora aff. communis PSN243 TaxID=3040156 RepID=A0AAV9GCB2_9PEZI|nr:putative letm1-like protein [Podospora aff. communis PSN243]
MPRIEAVFTEKAPRPLPQFSQAVKYNGMVYCSGNIGLDPATWKTVEGTVKDRTRQALKNLSAVLDEAGSGLRNVVKMNVFLTTMDNFAAMNEAYDDFFTWDPKPNYFQLRGPKLQFRPPSLPQPTTAANAMRHSSALRGVLRNHPSALSNGHILSACPPQPRFLLPITTTTTLRAYSSSEKPPPLNPSAANPPSTTRPPPLNLPNRTPETSTFSHLFATGKAYFTFYKTGLRQIYTNTRVFWPPQGGSPPFPPPAPNTRAALQFRARWRHDITRLPQFGLILLVCGEFTPFIVPFIPGVVPLTCRIPAQVGQLLRKGEGRRKLAREERRNKGGSVVGYTARALGLCSSVWERVGLGVPEALVAGRVNSRLRFLAEDDRLLMEAGGARALEGEEVRLACVERGINVLERDDKTLRGVLHRWLSIVGRKGLSEDERQGKMMELILTEDKDW